MEEGEFECVFKDNDLSPLASDKHPDINWGEDCLHASEASYRACSIPDLHECSRECLLNQWRLLRKIIGLLLYFHKPTAVNSGLCSVDALFGLKTPALILLANNVIKFSGEDFLAGILTFTIHFGNKEAWQITRDHSDRTFPELLRPEDFIRNLAIALPLISKTRHNDQLGFIEIHALNSTTSCNPLASFKKKWTFPGVISVNCHTRYILTRYYHHHDKRVEKKGESEKDPIQQLNSLQDKQFVKEDKPHLNYLDFVDEEIFGNTKHTPEDYKLLRELTVCCDNLENLLWELEHDRKAFASHPQANDPEFIFYQGTLPDDELRRQCQAIIQLYEDRLKELQQEEARRLAEEGFTMADFDQMLRSFANWGTSSEEKRQ